MPVVTACMMMGEGSTRQLGAASETEAESRELPKAINPHLCPGTYQYSILSRATLARLRNIDDFQLTMGSAEKRHVEVPWMAKFVRSARNAGPFSDLQTVLLVIAA